jgi:hypothetical protein
LPPLVLVSGSDMATSSVLLRASGFD